MNKKTGITRACQRFGRMVETRDITGLRHLLRYYSPNNGIEHSTWRVIVTPWSWWDCSDRIAVILTFPIFHTYWMAISFSFCLLFLTLASPLIRFIYHGPKFTTPGSHYRVKMQDLKLMENDFSSSLVTYVLSLRSEFWSSFSMVSLLHCDCIATSNQHWQLVARESNNMVVRNLHPAISKDLFISSKFIIPYFYRR